MRNKFLPLSIGVILILAMTAPLFLLQKYYSDKVQILESSVSAKTRDAETYRKMLKAQSIANQESHNSNEKMKLSPKLIFVEADELSTNDLLSHTKCTDVSDELITNGKFDQFINDKKNTTIEKCIDNFSEIKTVFYSIKENRDTTLLHEYQNGTTSHIFYSRDWNLGPVDCSLVATRSVQGVPGNEVAAGAEDFILCSKKMYDNKIQKLVFISASGYGMGGRTGIVRCSRMFGYCSGDELINVLANFGLLCKFGDSECPH